MTNERLNELLDTKSEKNIGHLLVSVGSWKAYNDCSKHSEGSPFIDFIKLNGSEELEEALKALGWSDEEKEELFIQDYISDFFSTENADFENPRELAEFIDENSIDTFADDDFLKLSAIEEAITPKLQEAIECFDDYELKPGTAADYAEEITDESYKLDEHIKYYIDFEKMGQDMIIDGDIFNTSVGLLKRI